MGGLPYAMDMPISPAVNDFVDLSTSAVILGSLVGLSYNALTGKLVQRTQRMPERQRDYVPPR